MRQVDPVRIRPIDIQPGDVMLVKVKAIVVGEGRYRIYRCNAWEQGIPDGDRIINEKEVCEALFPSLAHVAEPDCL